jgi:hyperosmotically inducible periplasmic protein
MKKASLALFAVGALLSASFAFGAGTNAPARSLEDKVRHELVMLPYYGVFDNLTYSVDHGVVTLGGSVSRPVVERDAINVVKRIPGVERVENRIEVQPLSSFDNRIRRATLNAIYGFAPLQRYGWGTQPSIRILVNNGHVTLAGVVRSEADRNMAFIRANSIPGVFEVRNELRIEGRDR